MTVAGGAEDLAGKTETERAGEDAAGTPFPLTDIQAAYWVGRNNALELGNVPPQRWIEVEGRDLDIDRFADSLRRLIERHDMLRAVVTRDGLQQILPEVPEYHVELIDLRAQPRALVAERLAAVRHAVANEQFVTDRWPLFSVRASRLADRHFRLHFSFDMLLVDLMSFQIMFRDLALLYEARDDELPTLEYVFRDYVLAVGALRDSAAHRKSREHWWKRIPNLPPMPELPLLRPLRSLATPEFAQRAAVVKPAVWERVKERGAEAGLTPSTVALTAFCEVVQTWSARMRFTLLMTAFNRRPLHPQVNDIIGDFTSTIVLDVEADPGESFLTRAARVQHRVWVGFRHGLVSGIEVLREMNRQNGTPARAAAPVVFNSTLQATRDDLPPPSTLEGPLPIDETILSDQGCGPQWQRERQLGALGEVVYSAGQAPQILLEARASERAGHLVVVVDSVDELFPDGLVDEMVAALETQLHRLDGDEAAWTLPTAPPVPPAQLAQRRAINAAARQPVESLLLHELVARRVADSPERTAAAWSGGRLTFAELGTRSAQLGRQLRARGVERGELVPVVMERGWEQMVGALGILAAGGAYVPVDPELPCERLWHLLHHSRARTVVSQRRVVEAVEPDDLTWVAVDDEVDTLPDAAPRSLAPDDLAYVMYTSGSTGLPKGVMIDHGGAANTIVDLNQRFGITAHDRVLSVSSLTFDLSVYDIFGVVGAGGAVVLLDPCRSRDPAHWVELMADEEVTVWNSVPSLMELLVEHLQEHPRLPRPPLRLVLLSGDWIPTDLPDRIRTLFQGARVVGLGGATEASIWSTYYPIGRVDESWKRIPYGRPLANQSGHVLDAALNPCPVWVPGSFYIGGRGVARGYWQDPEKTAAAFITHPSTGERLYRTGDVCRYLPDGNLDILGREDFQVKVRGFRVELGEIEAALLQHVAVDDVVVVARGERSLEKRLIAYVVADPRAPLAPADLYGFLRSKLPHFMVPSTYVQLPALPRNPNGKIAYDALPDPSAKQVDVRWRELHEEDRALGHAVARIVGSVLGLADLGSDDFSLLDLGATSIDYIRLINRMEEELGFRPDLERLLDDPRLSALTRTYREWLGSNAGGN